MKKKHSKFAASASHRWLNCPGSITLSENAPDQIESPYALEGTMAHECLEDVLKSLIKGRSPETLLRQAYPKEMLTHALSAVQEIEKRRAPGATLLCETKVSLDFVHPDMFGTVDAAIVEPFGRLHVIDYKYGAGIAVDVKDNPQLIYYALGLANRYHYNFDDVAIVVIQPRAEHHEGPVREQILSIDELLEWEEVFTNGVSAALTSKPNFISGDWCRFCPASAICPELSKKSFETAMIEFAPSEERLETPRTEWSGEELSFILPAIEKIETWIKAVKEHAFNRLNRGEKIPGWKLVQKRSTRKWIDEDATGKEALKLWGDKAFTTPELLSPAQLEKLPNAKSFVGSRVTDVSSGLTLAPESDKRMEVNPVENDFKDFPVITAGENKPNKSRKGTSNGKNANRK